MKILLTNDDGIFAEGIIALAKILIDLGEVYVVAPNRQRSAVSHGITVHEPIIVREVDFPVDVIKAYSISGKPADCVRVGIVDLIGEKPDIVVSGMNAGPNFGQDVMYSGTVSGAIEGMFYGIPSIAISLDGSIPDIANVHVKSIIEEFIKSNKDPKIIWNVNIPAMPLENYKGITHAPLAGHSQYPYLFHKYQSGEKEWYYFPISEAVGALEENTDVDYVRKGYITITPLSFNLEEKGNIPELPFH
jgi:5'-nucleotidase